MELSYNNKNLDKVINPTIYITYAYNFLKTFLSKEFKNLIIFNTECKNIEKIII